MSVHVLVGCQYSQLIDIVTDDAWTMIFMVQNESLVNGFTPDRLVFRLVSFFFLFVCVGVICSDHLLYPYKLGRFPAGSFQKKRLVCYLIWYTFSMYLCLSIIAKMSWFAKGLLRCSFWCKVLTRNSSYLNLISNHEIFRRCTHVSKDTLGSKRSNGWSPNSWDR